jgi:hypothetical protein
MLITYTTPPRFFLGQLVATPNALATFPEDYLERCINRHANCDWGDLCEEDRESNEAALGNGARLFSSYVTPELGKLWIITEGDESATTLLLPEDY